MRTTRNLTTNIRFTLVRSGVFLLCGVLANSTMLRTGTAARTARQLPAMEIPKIAGWWEIPNTQLQSVCPENNFNNSGYPFKDACHNVADAWSGGVADTAGNRLIVWGGGHSDYSGNEVYEL